MLRKWEDLPEFMKCEEVRKYYDILKRKKVQLRIKRTCDELGAGVLLDLLAVPRVLIAAAIKADSPGTCVFQTRTYHCVRKKISDTQISHNDF